MYQIPAGTESSDEDDLHVEMMLENWVGGLNQNGHAILDEFDMEDIFDDDFDHYGYGYGWSDIEDDDDDYGLMYDAFDHDYDDDGEDKWSTDIFRTLEDSFTILPRLVFHKEGSDSITRLPTLLPNMTETYERLYALVEELELLLKAWRKRVRHPFTAHLEPVPTNGSLIESAQIDFSLSDVESDTTEPRLFSSSFRMPKKAATVNESLTKKKYCQSARTFYDVFDNEAEFESVLGQVRALRKYVYSIGFGHFLANVPRERLPNELWEKIWILVTRSSYNPDSLATHSFGVRAKERKAILLENDRVTKLFGAVGNLHMLVFEILFKHANILRVPEMLEIYIGPKKSLAELRYYRTIFYKYYDLFKMSYARLMAIDEKAGPVEKTSNSITDCLENGIVTMKGVNVSKVNAGTDHSRILAMMSIPGRLAFVTNMWDLELAATCPQIVIWDVEAGKVVARVRIGKCLLDFRHNLMRDMFVFTRDAFAFVEKSPDDAKSFELHSWRMDKTDEEGTPKAIYRMGDKDGLIIAHPEDESANQCAQHQLLTVAADRHVVLTWFRSYEVADEAADSRTYLTFVGPGSGSPLSKLAVVKYADEGWWTCAASRSDHAVLQNDNVLHFVRLDRATYIVRSRNLADVGPDEENVTVAVAFDEYAPTFAVFRQFMFNCILYSYDESDGPPTPVRRVSSFAPQFDEKTIQSAVLRDGTLFGIYHRDPGAVLYMPSSPSAYSREGVFEVVAFDTAKAKALPVFSMVRNKDLLEDLMMNEYSCAFFVHHPDFLSHYNSHSSLRNLAFVDERTLIVRNDEKMYISVRFNAKPSEVAAVEAEELYSVQLKREAALKKAEEAKRRKQETQKRADDAREKYVDKLVAARATIYLWRKTYGFAKLTGDAKPLGRCFVHVSELPRNMSARNGVTIECHLVQDADKDNLRATNVKVVSIRENNRGQRGRRGRGSRGGQR